MVLVIHANFVSLPIPQAVELEAAPLATSFRFFVESLGIVSINVFILISGWFRVKNDPKHILSFVFRVLFFGGGGYLFCLLIGRASLSLKGILDCFAFTRWDWFIKAYAVLLIVSPILNVYLDKASTTQLRNVLIAFYLFQSTYGWIGGGQRFFVQGYGPLSFIGLYLLAQFIRRVSANGDRSIFTFRKSIDLLIVWISAIVNTVFSLVFLSAGHSFISFIFAYSSPLVVLGSLYLFLFFSKLKIRQSRIINWMGASSFAVYLLHSQVDLREFFTEVIIKLDASFHGFPAVGMILLFLFLTFIVSVSLDQIRIALWNRLLNRWKSTYYV